MELETLQKAEKIKKQLSRLKRSKEVLDFFTEGKDEIYLQVYVESSSEAFIVPKEFGRTVIDLIYDLLDKETKKVEQQFKEL